MRHYFERAEVPFLSIGELPYGEARPILLTRQKLGKPGNPDVDGFLEKRYSRDEALYEAFLARGGKPERKAPVYFFLGEHPQWASGMDNPAIIKIPLHEFSREILSFTYGDSFAVLNPDLFGTEEYWGKVYFSEEILGVISRNGYPPHVEYDFKKNIYPTSLPLNHCLKYIEAHVWSNTVLEKYKVLWMENKKKDAFFKTQF